MLFMPKFKLLTIIFITFSSLAKSRPQINGWPVEVKGGKTYTINYTPSDRAVGPTSITCTVAFFSNAFLAYDFCIT